MSSSKGFLFDLNGTMVDDMEHHITAWHQILNELGASISYEQMKAECYGKNNELLERIFPGRFIEEEKNKLSLEKEKQYQKEFRPKLKLIDGLNDFLEIAYQQQIKIAIGSAAIMFNIDFVLDELSIRHYFEALVSADDVLYSKPHPETYLKCADLLKVSPKNCIVFEDSPKGVESALNAGMKAVVLTTLLQQHEFEQYPNIVAFVPNFKALDPAMLLAM